MALKKVGLGGHWGLKFFLKGLTGVLGIRWFHPFGLGKIGDLFLGYSNWGKVGVWPFFFPARNGLFGRKEKAWGKF